MSILIVGVLLMSTVCSVILVAACILGARMERTAPLPPSSATEPHAPDVMRAQKEMHAHRVVQDMATVNGAERNTANRSQTDSAEENTLATRMV